ncbi:MAG TPA: type I methionyl aminopeptidase [Phycisphaerae bacterium]|nr:type I methionyl aminopeptidase [Phycisphaerae bacterium]
MKRRAGTAGLKRSEEIEAMRQAGRVVHQVLERVGQMVRPGVTTVELNAEAERMIAAAGAEPLFKGVESRQAAFPFPSALCTSVDEQVVHGVPDGKPLVEGSVVSVDCGVRLHGYCGDAAMTFPVGRISPEAERLLAVTREALEIAIGRMRPKRWWSEIAGAMQAHVEAAGFSMVREFVGHGIGQMMHEEPKVPNYVDPREHRLDFVLLPGMVLAVEPMVNMGTAAVEYTDTTGWPVTTRDRNYSAHFEHTIAVTDRGADVLTDGR